MPDVNVGPEGQEAGGVHAVGQVRCRGGRWPPHYDPQEEAWSSRPAGTLLPPVLRQLAALPDSLW